MRKFLLAAALLALGAKYGFDYILSEKFQTYSDKTKAPWTCNVNYFIAGVYTVMSEYKEALPLYQRILTRCPDDPIAVDAEFGVARSLEETFHQQEAVEKYKEFAEKHKNHPKAKLAIRSVEILASSH